MMKNFEYKIRRFFRFTIYSLLPLVGGGWVGASCSDMLETESELVEYEKDNTLNHATDSVYSVMGIINRMQIIADRTMLLGELRGDLVTTTDAASADLKRLAAFDQNGANKYYKISDYYAVINNCNYYLAHVDTMLTRRGRELFKYEYAAVKAFRAWTYLELAKAYGSVPLVLTPVMTEKAASDAMNQDYKDITAICNYFISDLTPYAKVELPQFGAINQQDSKEFFIPMRALLGDLCLWAGRYQEAAYWYHDYLNDKDNPVTMNYSNRTRWIGITNFQSQIPANVYSVTDNMERLTYIPMEARVFDGTISELPDIYQSTTQNKFYFQAQPSTALRRLSAAQTYCIEYKNNTITDTIYAPTEAVNYRDGIYVGDLRLSAYYRQSSYGQDEYSEYSSLTQSISKFYRDRIIIYRKSMVYLRYAEALNRAGYPQSAFAILKYGICNEIVNERVDSVERAAAGELIYFDPNMFTKETSLGIHSFGSGDSECNKYYQLPVPADSLNSRQDTIDYQIPLVEDLIINEMALEGALEGYRFYDLMRVALRRGDAAYLADPVSRRNGDKDESLYQLLLNKQNWYLPKR